MKLVFISHCNFEGNSAMHIFGIANEFVARGHECIMLVPDRPETVISHGKPNFCVLGFEDALSNDGPLWRDDAPDLLLPWTPRNHVVSMTRAILDRHPSPYVVHMEDNEEQIVRAELSQLEFGDLQALPTHVVERILVPWRSHPETASEFIASASGYTCLIESLLEFKPAKVPGLMFWPGFDHAFASVASDDDRARTRKELGLKPDEIAVLYSGNVHALTAGDVAKLYAAVMLLRRQGRSVRLVRTGWDFVALEIGVSQERREASIELGFVDRDRVPQLVQAADILVQPGRSDRFNDYRFPSKLPEYLVSGRPVILPDSNIGKELKGGVEALKLSDGTIAELQREIARIIDDETFGRRLGTNSRRFALEKLTWPGAVDRLEPFYRTVVERAATMQVQQDEVPGTVVAAALSPPRYPVKLIAHYLPQFHPIPENDAWWGEGFTEWTNVTRARPYLEGQKQPRRPTELGYYDLREPNVFHEQVRLARDHGIHGFCFYYYWFSGRRLLEAPLDAWLSDRSVDFPFCLSWANEPWSRRWDGSDAEVLMPQNYQKEDTDRFFMDVLPFLKDERYIRVDGKPLLVIYRVVDLPDPITMIARWKELARQSGLGGLHVACTQSFGISDPRPYGCDAAVEFSPPHVDRMLVPTQRVADVSPQFVGYLEDYVSVAMKGINADPKDYVQYRGCFPMWDNTPRRLDHAHILINESTKAYAVWLRFLVKEALVRRSQQEPLVFINAWNEWAEGAYLEPDERLGRSLLEVGKAALEQGIVDFELGFSPERERCFFDFVSRTPRG